MFISASHTQDFYQLACLIFIHKNSFPSPIPTLEESFFLDSFSRPPFRAITRSDFPVVFLFIPRLTKGPLKDAFNANSDCPYPLIRVLQIYHPIIQNVLLYTYGRVYVVR